LTFLAFPLTAQEVTGTIAGVVADSSGAVVPGVTVTVRNTGTNATYSGVTNELGTYSIRSLPVGSYSLRAESTGFKAFQATDIGVQVNEVARVDVVLELGEVTETVEIRAQVVAVDTESATLKTVVDQRRVQDLPLNGRDAVQLMRLVAGVSDFRGADVTSGTTYPGSNPVSVSGGRGNTTNYILDGGQNNDHYSNAPSPMPNPDALQEFSVQTNNFSAEFGRSSGGIVNAVTKSGTNQLHSAAFWYLRHHSLNAANFFAPPKTDSPNEKQDDGLKRNQFGATLGGPVYLPGIYSGKDKTFFFFSYQGTRIRRKPTYAFRIVPTPLERGGNFSEQGRPLKDPFGGGYYPDNIIPASDFFAGSKYFIDNFIPPPTTGQHLTTSQISNYDDNQYLAKIDQQFGPDVRFSGRMYWSRASQPGPLDQSNFYQDGTNRQWWNTSAVGNLQWVVSPSVLNQTVFGWNQMEGPCTQDLPNKNWNDLGVNITLDEFTQYHMSFDTISGINTGDTNNFFRADYQLVNTTRWTKGRHNLTFGGEWGYGFGDVRNNYYAQGRFRWKNNAPYTGRDIADFLVGKFERFAQGVGEFRDTEFDIFNLFFNDSMKVTRTFTLNVGVRWEPFFAYTEKYGKLASWGGWDAQSSRYPNAPAGLLFPGDPGLPEGGYDTSWGNFGPRLGIAWDITGDGKTSLRAGYGIFFDRFNTLGQNSAATQGPFGARVTIYGQENDSMADPYANFPGGNPFPVIGFGAIGTEVLNPGPDATFLVGHQPFTYVRDMRNPYVQTWNLTLERQIAGGWVARASYAGSKGTALTGGRDFNAPFPDAYASTATTNQRRPYWPVYGQWRMMEPVNLSNFHAFQITAEKRFSQGFTVLANYQFSKTIDNAGNNSNKANGINLTNPFDRSYDRGVSGSDQPHIFNLSGLWELPVRFDNRAAQFFIGGWNLSAILSAHSGTPFSISAGEDTARVGSGSRADLVGDPDLGDRSRGEMVEEYLNKAAFAKPATGTFGNLGKNVFRGPGYLNLDFGLHKDLPITETVKAQFRFEAFNLFNNVNLNGPQTNIRSGNFMRITSARDPRILQFALRLSF